MWVVLLVDAKVVMMDASKVVGWAAVMVVRKVVESVDVWADVWVAEWVVESAVIYITSGVINDGELEEIGKVCVCKIMPCQLLHQQW